MIENYLELTAEIVTAYVLHNSVPAGDLSALIGSVHAALCNLSSVKPLLVEELAARPTSAEIRKSITREELFSFEDGKPYRTLKRHLHARGLSPQAYRQKWSLPSDYPMVAPGYSARRSALALSLGLGQVGRKA